MSSPDQRAWVRLSCHLGRWINERSELKSLPYVPKSSGIYGQRTSIISKMSGYKVCCKHHFVHKLPGLHSLHLPVLGSVGRIFWLMLLFATLYNPVPFRFIMIPCHNEKPCCSAQLYVLVLVIIHASSFSIKR